MIKNGRHSIQRHTTLDYSFSGIRIDDRRASPSSWNLTIDLGTSQIANKSAKDIQNDALIYQKLHFWLDINMPDIVFVNVNENEDMYIANILGNIAMYCPEPPNDYTIIRLLHSKICALAGDSLVVGEMRLRSRDSTLHYVFNTGPGETLLPLTTKEYYKNGKCRDVFPWWDRDDGFCFEFIIPEGIDSNVDKDELFSDVEDPMEDFWKIISEMEDRKVVTSEESGKIIRVEKWKPKIV